MWSSEETGCPQASPIQKMKVLLEALEALGGRFDLGASVSNTSLICFSSGLGGSPLLVFVGVHAMLRIGDGEFESWS